jgi:glucokinase
MAAEAPDSQVTARMVFEASDAGDPAACEIIARVIRIISKNLAGVVTLLDLDILVFGGGVVRAAPWFVARIDQDMRNLLMTVEARRDLRLETESFPNSALWGAAANAFLCQGVLAREAL